jgi:hypothetical protein
MTADNNQDINILFLSNVWTVSFYLLAPSSLCIIYLYQFKLHKVLASYAGLL